MQIPLFGLAAALLLLIVGMVRRHNQVTAGALILLVAVAIVAVPIFIKAVDDHQDAVVAAMIGLDATAAIALVTLVVWQITRRYPYFTAAAILIIGLFAFALVVHAG